MSNLDFADDLQVVTSALGDLPNFFYNLELPADLWPYFVLGDITTEELENWRNGNIRLGNQKAWREEREQRIAADPDKYFAAQEKHSMQPPAALTPMGGSSPSVLQAATPGSPGSSPKAPRANLAAGMDAAAAADNHTPTTMRYQRGGLGIAEEQGGGGGD